MFKTKLSTLSAMYNVSKLKGNSSFFVKEYLEQIVCESRK